MEFLLPLILLGLISYFLFKKIVGQITRTPIWLLWLVMMIPPIIWVSAKIILDQQDQQKIPLEQQPLPLMVFLAPLVICFIVYLWLVEIGRPKPELDKTAITNSGVDAQNISDAQEKLAQLRPITSNEEKALRDCFPWGVYYLQHIDYRPQAILCRGKLRSVPEMAYQIITKNVEQVFGNRFVVIFQESLRGQPFFALVPNPESNPNQEVNEPLTRPGLAFGLLFITLFTTTVIGVELNDINPEQLQNNPSLLLQGLPYGLSMILILGSHELSHYLTATYYQIRATLPYFIPIPFFLGTFGAFTQMRSPIPHRKALFDISISGPLVGFIITLPLLIWGLSHSSVVSIAENNTSLFNFEALDPRFSFFLAVLSKLALGHQFVPDMAVKLHPTAVAGYIGVLFTALNLVPVGQLDGGHIVHAMFGQRTAMIIAQITRFLMLILGMIRGEYFLWAIILFFLPVIDQPALNDVTELNNIRDLSGLLSLALLIIILLPLPDAIAIWLNI